MLNGSGPSGLQQPFLTSILAGGLECQKSSSLNGGAGHAIHNLHHFTISRVVCLRGECSRTSEGYSFKFIDDFVVVISCTFYILALCLD